MFIQQRIQALCYVVSGRIEYTYLRSYVSHCFVAISPSRSTKLKRERQSGGLLFCVYVLMDSLNTFVHCSEVQVMIVLSC